MDVSLKQLMRSVLASGSNLMLKPGAHVTGGSQRAHMRRYPCKVTKLILVSRRYYFDELITQQIESPFTYRLRFTNAGR